MELASQAKKKDLDDVWEKLKESLSDADDNRRLLIERDNLVDQLKDDKVKCQRAGRNRTKGEVFKLRLWYLN